MGTKNFFILRTDFYFLDRGFVLGFLCKNMFWLLGLLCNSLFFVLGSVMRCFSRVQESEESEPSSGSDSRAIEARQDNQTCSRDDGLGEKQTSEVPCVVYEDSDEREAGSKSSVFSAPISTTSKYQFISGRNVSEFVEEPRIMSLTIQEMFVGSTDSSISADKQLSYCDFEAIEDEEPEDSVLTFSFGMVLEKNDEEQHYVVGSENDVSPLHSKNDVLGNHDLSDEAQLHSKFDFCPKQDSISTEHDLGSCEFLLGENVSEDFGCESETNSDPESDAISDRACVVEDDSEPIVTGDGSDELVEFEGPISVDGSEEEEEEAVIYEGTEQMEEPEGQNFDDSEDDVGWDFISEHEDLIEQLKVELKNVRIGGLPTILEESESPKIVEDLKPLKIDEKKLEHKDRIEQIQKVYKTYVEKMRKLDILSYQTIHAIGFISRKDQSGLIPVRKPSTMKFQFLQNLMGSKARMVGDDPVGELERDLELVYVGQACLSWKILHWQYEKAKELCDHDPHRFRQYNQVAGEFQLFQVLVQRYVEDETFQGPRVQHYVKNRCIIKNLLQVPVIRDDKKGRKGEEEIPISSAMLRDIIHGCMRVFWAFLRSDKKGTNVISQHVQVELQNPADKTLLIEVQTDLQKKERKLKDILRTGNCIVKKFQKHNQREIRLDHVLFVAQVELRLVSRVLSMSKLTSQQLVWCHEQLGMINFTSRKVYLEPSFLLFPC